MFYYESENSRTHPDNNSAGLIVGTDLEIRAFGNMVPQELEQILRFLDFVAHDPPCKPLVDV